MTTTSSSGSTDTALTTPSLTTLTLITDVSTIISETPTSVKATITTTLAVTTVPRNVGVPDGQVAGISIACTIVGIALGVVISFIAFRRKKSNRFNNNPPRPNTAMRNVPGSASCDLDGLPQETGHDTLRHTVSGLEISIKNFVHEFFHNQPLSHRELDDGTIVDLLDVGLGDRQALIWPSQLKNSQNRSTALKSYLARVLFSRINPYGNPETSLLPEEMLRCYHGLLLEETQNGIPQSPSAGKPMPI